MKSTKLFLISVFSCFLLVGCNSGKSNQNSQEKSNEIVSTEDYSAVQESSCNYQTAQLIGMAYVLSDPTMSIFLRLNENSYTIENFVNDYGQLLSENGDLIKCMRKLGQSMVNQGTQNYNFSNADENNVRESVYSSLGASGIDAVGIANDIVGDMQQTALQPIMIGTELVWLSQVLPDAAASDWSSFNNTGSIFRNMSKENAAQAELALSLLLDDQDMMSMLSSLMPSISEMSIKETQNFIIGIGYYNGFFK